MNNLFLGLLNKILVTSFCLSVTVLTNSALAGEGVDKSNNKQLSAFGVSQQGSLFNRAKTSEKIKLLRIEGIKFQNLSQFEKLRPKFRLNRISFSDSFGEAPLNYSSVQDYFGFHQQPLTIANSKQQKPTLKDAQPRIRRLRNLDQIKLRSYYAAPSLSVYIPVGYGSHKNTGFVSASYQSEVRLSRNNDAALGFGVGLGDADKSVGVVVSYTAASFGGSRDFGSGGFNLKLHRRFKGNWSAAIGMNGILNIGDYENSSIDGVNDFEHSLYTVATKIFRTRENINKPFSRLAVTAGIGNGEYRTESSILDDDNNFNVFGNAALRVNSQASLIAEWTGQDLAVGASIIPFKKIPLVITPAIRDIAGPGDGASDGARFVIGTGFGFTF